MSNIQISLGNLSSQQETGILNMNEKRKQRDAASIIAHILELSNMVSKAAIINAPMTTNKNMLKTNLK